MSRHRIGLDGTTRPGRGGEGETSGRTVRVTLSPDVIAAIAERTADAIGSLLSEMVSPWMTRCEAAEHLALPLSRLEKDRRIPCHRDGGRVLYHRAEIDDYFLKLGR